MSIDWSLECCNDKQFLSIFLIICYAVAIFKLWRVSILHPFKILTVFLHELGHATAAWLTCGSVKGMEVHPDEGGVTKTVGGLQWVILPAGYLGSAVWGMALTIASADKTASEVAAGILIFFLLVFIFYAHNGYLRILNFCFILLLAGLLALNIWTTFDALQYVTLFVGVMSCLFSVYDIWDDLISRRVNESDASVFAKMTHTSSRCWGVIWGLIALVSLVAAVYFNLLVAEDSGESLTNISDASAGTKVALACAVVIVALAVVHTGFTRRCMLRKRDGFGSYFAA
ncbi:hypothetical protein F441_13982 [Phytophthora nicotianae CJ01A1]|uniref:Peptidase M50B-like-domain-containing protein n=5 Tax=Phytophthora nicotianae TaxID=4792 RepID=V9EMU6_PHYNI|nr:hypothetical protein F443_14056 [Phytophthora nicotianae P1569]ETK80673.1 hypothetical protein L915_13699 [Phytophthora nicotianae]ETO69280.1 hypothetical protein F444_14087 [Phytophthora nicotianae P1976]ETP10330.1 hypothetical protein F441_13982 [Phytophthora nicotianae CJ01A1]ETP38492.1 hypothetical protein F442_13899 [Phytophthora nicotianae P10297]